MRYLLLVSLMMMSLSVYAQDDKGSIFDPPQREIYTVLAYGDDVFEPDLWRVSADEQDLRTTAHWRSADLGAWAYMDYLHYDGEITADDFDETFDDFWFDGTFANYDSYEETERCDFEDGTILLYFDIQDNNLSYIMRYWLIPASATRVAAMFIGFPAGDEDQLADYAERFLPDMFECNQ